MARSNGQCEDCLSGVDECGRLTLHHLTYTVSINGDSPEPIYGKETPDDLVALCWPCHKSRHLDINGDYWRDPTDMEAHWSTYYEEMNRK